MVATIFHNKRREKLDCSLAPTGFFEEKKKAQFTTHDPQRNSMDDRRF
jgi:hypothetical protein